MDRVSGLDRVVAIINGKGGTLKTSVTASVGALAAAAGWRVLLIDFDSQGNLTEDLGLVLETDEGDQQYQRIPRGEPFTPISAGREGLWIVPGGDLLEDLAAVMTGRQSRDPEGWRYALSSCLAPIVDDYDLVLIDCPPKDPVFQVLALVAASRVLIPTRSDAGSRKGLRGVAKRFLEVRETNPKLRLLGVVRTGIGQASRTLRAQTKQEIEEDLGGVAPVLETCIRYAESPAKIARDTGRLPHELEPELRAQKNYWERRAAGEDDSPVLPQSTLGLAQDYIALTKEVLAALTQEEVA